MLISNCRVLRHPRSDQLLLKPVLTPNGIRPERRHGGEASAGDQEQAAAFHFFPFRFPATGSSIGMLAASVNLQRIASTG